MDDLISRQQAIDAVNSRKTAEQSSAGIMRNAVVDFCVDIIKKLPPIQPKRGKWHYSDGKPARIGLSFGVVCDQCGTESEYCTNFCGECGADMRGEQDDESRSNSNAQTDTRARGMGATDKSSGI